MSSINFDNAYLLLIALPLAALLSVPFFIAVRKSNVNGHNIASLVMHLLMAVIIAFTAAGTTIVTTVTETNVYVVADVSYSANKNLDVVDEYIRNISLPKNSRMGVICFGKNYKLLTKLGEKFSTVRNAKVDDSETNITDALVYAGSLFREGVIKRIVLITDGGESYTGDSNSLKRTIDNLAADNVHVDAIFLDDNIADGVAEVQISEVSYTEHAYLGHSEGVSAVIQSGADGLEATAALYHGETLLKETGLSLSRGVNTVTFDDVLITDLAGTYDYEIRVRATGDENQFNNSMFFTQNVSDSINILLVSQNREDYDTVVRLRGSDENISAPLINNAKLPYSIEELCQYDEIILSDVDVSEIPNYQLFLDSVDKAVSLFGKSLLTLGDMGIQNDFDGKLKQLDDMLPVGFGNGNQDDKLYTIVLDISRSMNQLSKWARAKAAALQLIDFLNDDDNVCIVLFYGDAELYAPMDNFDREEAKAFVDNISLQDLEQGTFIGFGMDTAFEAIKNRPYREMQIMLITDGLTNTSDDDPVEIARKIYTEGITLSVIDVGRGADTGDTATKAKQLLENIARQGGGTYYLANTESELEGIIFGDVANNLNETIIEHSTNVELAKRLDETAEGITDFSYIDGFINSRAKASATTVLTVKYLKANGGSATVPLYAYRTYGKGKVATFTSRLNGSWIEPWTRDGGPYDKFFGNVLSLLTPSEKISCPFLPETVSEDGYTTISVTPATIRADAEAHVTVVTPDGETIESAMAFDSLSYSYRLVTPSVGNYKVAVTYSYSGKDYTHEINISVSYLPEYNSFAVYEASGLNRVIGENGTVSVDGKLKLVNDDKEMGIYSINLTVPLLIICVVLFAADICVRKLKWNDIKSLFKKVNK